MAQPFELLLHFQMPKASKSSKVLVCVRIIEYGLNRAKVQFRYCIEIACVMKKKEIYIATKQASRMAQMEDQLHRYQAEVESYKRFKQRAKEYYTSPTFVPKYVKHNPVQVNVAHPLKHDETAKQRIKALESELLELKTTKSLEIDKLRY